MAALAGFLQTVRVLEARRRGTPACHDVPSRNVPLSAVDVGVLGHLWRQQVPMPHAVEHYQHARARLLSYGWVEYNPGNAHPEACRIAPAGITALTAMTALVDAACAAEEHDIDHPHPPGDADEPR
jgi:hypothetical protein